MNVSVFGLGKLGMPFASFLASAGHHVHCHDPNTAVVDALNQGKTFLMHEPGVPELVAANALRLHGWKDPLFAADRGRIAFIIVPTPSQEDGSFSADTILETLPPIAAAIVNKSCDSVVVTCTTSPGTMDDVVLPKLHELTGKIAGFHFAVNFNPHFIALGSVLENMRRPDFVLIGGASNECVYSLEQFYRDTYSALDLPVPPFAKMNLVNAELAKLATNCAVVSKISYANAIADLCERIPNADASVVCAAVGMDSRIGPKYLRPATAYGGTCFGRDGRAMMNAASKALVDMPMVEAADKINSLQIEKVVKVVLESNPAVVGLLGLSYKTNTPVIEESVAMHLIERLRRYPHVKILAHDPMASHEDSTVTRLSDAKAVTSASDVVVVCTPWPEYADLGADVFNPGAKIVDLWSVLQMPGTIRPGRHGDWTVEHAARRSGWSSSLNDKNSITQYIADALKAASSEKNALAWRSKNSIASVCDCVCTSHGLTFWRIAEHLDPSRRFVDATSIDRETRPLATAEYDGHLLCPAFCRYLARAIELDKLFGPLKGKRIAEIGGGWGGLCAVISRLFGFASYTIYDLPEIQSAQRRLLSAMRVENVNFATSFDPRKYDLLVSDYAFSELTDEEQERYVPVLQGCKDGAMLCPSHHWDTVRSVPADWLRKFSSWLPQAIVEWGGLMEHYRDLSQRFADPRTTDAYVWRTHV